jgi:hypothetical protein
MFQIWRGVSITLFPQEITNVAQILDPSSKGKSPSISNKGSPSDSSSEEEEKEGYTHSSLGL